MHIRSFRSAGLTAFIGLLGLAACARAVGDGQPALPDWPHIPSAIPEDPAVEARVSEILSSMTLAQKLGQMTQAEIKSITPEEVRRYHIGSVLNGGGSWPGLNKHAGVKEWLRLAQEYHEASMKSDARIPVPVLWGTDAVHGHNNVYGATLFPHNIGLGAAQEPALVQRIARATGQATRATGIGWVFAPTLAVAQDLRWGRSYESFSSDAGLVRSYAAAYTRGLQDSFRHDGSVVATAKHFIGDGATEFGRDQGNAMIPRTEMINVHGQGYYGALGAGAQTVMASFNSWTDVAAGLDYGKMHGSRELLTGALKSKMGFDGFVVSDWNGIAQIPGCTNASCPQAINAGVDMVMVPDEWRAFLANTTRQVESGEIPLSRINDAVRRILRVKLRAGLFERAPSSGVFAGRQDATVHRALAREAVRKSLVMLKNENGTLPLRKGQRVLVMGKSADSLANQSGGWSLTWQGTGNTNDDYQNAESVLSGLRSSLGEANVVHAPQPTAAEASRVDAVVVVIGETPYAETNGDVVASDSMQHSRLYPEDWAALQLAASLGRPVITVFLAGRPLYANDLINASDAFVVAWLPGSEGGGIADVLVGRADGTPRFDFQGRLPFSWPGHPCPPPENSPDAKRPPLFARGYGLRYAGAGSVPRLAEVTAGTCGPAASLPIFNTANQGKFILQVEAGGQKRPLGDSLNDTLLWPDNQPAVKVSTSQINTQQDAKLVSWLAPARLFSSSPGANNLNALAFADGALQFDVVVHRQAASPVMLTMGCGGACTGGLDIGPALSRLTPGKKATLTVPLRCFSEQKVDIGAVAAPFSVAAQAPFSAAFTRIAITARAASLPDALKCPAPATQR